MKPISKILIIVFLAAILITSCVGPQFMPKTEPTIAMETAMDMVQTAAVKTQTAQPTLTPTPTPTYLPWQVPTNTPLPRQTYIDPEGWYKVTFPIDWKPVDNKPNHFAGKNGDFFETGYLPEMGYVTNALTACLWFANIDAHEKYNRMTHWTPWVPEGWEPLHSCRVVSSRYDGYGPYTYPFITYEVQENPGADPAHRFFYLKQGFSNGTVGDASFSWTKPVNNQAIFDPGVAPLSPEESDFWGDHASLPSNITVTEFMLPPEAQVNPSEIKFYEFVPEELYREDAQVPTSTPYKRLTTEEQLASLGYELTGHPGVLRQLFRDGRLLFDNIGNVQGVYNFQTASGPINAFIVYAGRHDGFLVENDTINAWEYNHQDPPLPPILYQDELLWPKTTTNFEHIQVIKSNREVVFSFTTSTEPMYAVRNFSTWNGHWIMNIDNFLIQDGEILNEKFGYPEMFSWGLVRNRPIYFFRKGSRIGISYGNKILPIQYQDVAHGICCGYTINNSPYIRYNSIRFFGKKDGAWHYVVVKFE